MRLTVSCIFLVTVNIYQGVTSDNGSWKIEEYPEPLRMQYNSSVLAESYISCIVYMISKNCPPLLTIQDGYCYCLQTEVNSTFNNVRNVTSIFHRVAERETCEVKGYDLYLELGICVKMVTNPQKNWTDAKQYCNDNGGYLLNVISDEKLSLALMYQNITNSYITYVGGFAVHTENDMEFYWTRGGHVNETYWKRGEPNNIGGIELCMSVINEEGLNDISCTSKKPFLCEILIN